MTDAPVIKLPRQLCLYVVQIQHRSAPTQVFEVTADHEIIACMRAQHEYRECYGIEHDITTYDDLKVWWTGPFIKVEHE